MDSPFDDFVSVDSAPLFENAQTTAGEVVKLRLLWGDGVQVLETGATRTRVRARGRERTGWIANDALGGQSLLELYFIDVGQGDGVLIKSPDFRHLMIDGGWPRRNQDTGKNAADFVDWKFFEDYARDRIELEAMICSHNDQDHYGGLWDLLDASQSVELDASDVRVRDFYHAGLGWWRRPGGGDKWLGPHASIDGETFFTQLMGDRAAVLAAIAAGAQPALAGEWRDFLERVTQARWTDDTPTRITRLSHLADTLPGFAAATPTSPGLRVLAPVEFDVAGAPAIRRYGSTTSQNTNGSSVLLRLDYGRVRVLLTGDLNKRSQRALLEDYTGERQELACDVAKACHHGSDDVSFEFLQTLLPAVTVISSGDNEGHDHPRPSVVAASAITGFFEEHDDELVSPLVYSTELARSVSFGDPFRFEERDAGGAVAGEIDGTALDRCRIHYRETKSGERQPRVRSKRVGDALIVAGLIYGLVNVRTDGDTILCATLDEKDHDWRIHKLQSRF